MEEIVIKNQILRTYMPIRTYIKAKNASLSANYSEMMRNGILFIAISKKLKVMLNEKNITLESFLQKIFEAIENNLESWMDITPDYSPKEERKARMSNRLCCYAEGLTTFDVEQGVKNYAEQLIALDVLLFYIEEKDIEKTAYTIAEIFIKLFFKG